MTALLVPARNLPYMKPPAPRKLETRNPSKGLGGSLGRQHGSRHCHGQLAVKESIYTFCLVELLAGDGYQ